MPVVRDADQLSLAEIEKTIADFGKRARDGKLTIDEMQGGTFTITNGGVYGSLMSTPILNAPQSGILGMHKIQERPVVVDGKIEIRPMMYLALSYDHRIVDGREAVTFLVRVKEVWKIRRGWCWISDSSHSWERRVRAPGEAGHLATCSALAQACARPTCPAMTRVVRSIASWLPTISSSSAPAPAAMSAPSARRSSA